MRQGGHQPRVPTKTDRSAAKQPASQSLAISLGNLSHQFGPGHVDGSVNSSGLRSGIVLQDFYHQRRVVRENNPRLHHA